jgi:hypothetical protein
VLQFNAAPHYDLSIMLSVNCDLKQPDTAVGTNWSVYH